MQMRSTAVRWVPVTAAIAAAGLLVYLLRAVLAPVFFAFLLAYMLNPVVARFESRRVPRAAGIALLLGGVLVAIAAFALLLLPAIVSDLGALGRELPAAARRMLELAAPFLGKYGIEVPSSSDELLRRLQHHLSDLPAGAAGALGEVVKAVLGNTASFLNILAGAVMVPILSFYLLKDFDSLVSGARELIPPGSRAAVIDIAREVDQVLGQFIRGQLTVMAILALLYAVGYSLIGVRLAVPIGIVAGLLSFIPYLGGAAAFGLALLMVALHWTGWAQIVLLAAVYALIQLLEGFVITPRIVGDKLGLAPVWVLLGLMAGGNLFGFVGVLLALPATAVAKVAVVRGLESYKRSRVYRGPEPEQADPERQPEAAAAGEGAGEAEGDAATQPGEKPGVWQG
jgi:predicted PurR-regulated permease PerM